MMKNKNYLRIMAAGIMTAGMVSLSACSNNGSSATAVSPEQTTTAETVTESAAETTAAGTEDASAGAGADSEKPETTTASVETAAETTALLGSFTSVTLDGDEVNEEIFGQSKLTMVNIWGTFCGPCVMEMPDLAEISREYGGEDFQMVGIVVDADDAGNPDAVAIVDQTGADYTHIMLSQDLIDGFVGTVQAVPTTVFVDSEGRQVGKTYMGAKSKAQWEAVIKGLME